MHLAKGGMRMFRTPKSVLAGLVASLALAAQAASGQDWVKVNGGNYVDAGEGLSRTLETMAVSTLHMPDGDLLYFFHSLRVGKVMVP